MDNLKVRRGDIDKAVREVVNLSFGGTVSFRP